MTPDIDLSTYQFWLSWATQAAVALGTIGAVIAALFGNWLRIRLTPPKLVLTLKDPHGSKSPINLTSPDGATRQTMSRWYHGHIRNDQRAFPATQVQVFLLSVEELDAAGEYRATWVGEVPIKWRSQEVYPLVRTIGYAADCDLCSVIKDKCVLLHPLVVPLALKAAYEDTCHLILTFQARSIEADSNRLRVSINWNRKWSDDTEEMAAHMVVREASNGHVAAR